MGKKYIIYTDGSCTKNPGGDGGWACIIINNLSPVKLSGYEPETTNQRMELTAAIKAIQYTEKDSEIELFSDSAYMVNCMTRKWFTKWIENDWYNSKNEPVANRDLWEELNEAIKTRKITFNWVKGHNNNIFNEECDTMAKNVIVLAQRIKSSKR